MPFKNQRDPAAPLVYGGVAINPASGSVSGTSGAFEELEVGGQPFDSYMSDVLEASPLGIRMRHKMLGNSPYSSASSITLFSRPITLVGGRLYRLNVPPLEIVFRNSTTSSSGMFLWVQVFPRAHDQGFYAQQWYLYAKDKNTRGATITEGAALPIALPADSGVNNGTITARLFGPTNGGEYMIRGQYAAPEIQLEDVGPYYSAAFSDQDLAALNVSSGAPSPSASKVTTEYTGTFYASHYANFRTDSGAKLDYPGVLMQSTAVTPRAGLAAFNGTDQYGRTLAQLTASNVSIRKVVAHLGMSYGGKTTKWYYSAGGTGRLYWHTTKNIHTVSSLPSRTFIRDIPSWGNSQYKSTDITSTVAAAIRTGSFAGIGVSGEGREGQYTYHGQIPYRVGLSVTYSITE